MTPERLDEFREMVKRASQTQRRAHNWRNQYIEDVNELLDAVDVQDRVAADAEYAADRLWEAFDALQRSKLPSSNWRTRDQIVGLVPGHERRLGVENVTEGDDES